MLSTNLKNACGYLSPAAILDYESMMLLTSDYDSDSTNKVGHKIALGLSNT